VLVRAHTNKYARRTYDALFRLLEARHASNGMHPYLQLMSKLANISLITFLFLWAIGGAQGGALVTPGESSKPMSNDQEGKIARDQEPHTRHNEGVQPECTHRAGD